MTGRGTEFIREMLDQAPDGATRAKLALVASRFAGETVYIPGKEQRANQERFAQKLLTEGWPLRDVVVRLSQAYCVSRRTALRRVKQLRQLS